MKIIKTLLIILYLFSLYGCSVYMAATQPNAKNLSVLNKGTYRHAVIKELGTPASSDINRDGKSDIHNFVDGYSVLNRSLRTTGHLLADFYTLGIWEIAGIPIEGLNNGERIRVNISYNENNTVSYVSKLKNEGDGKNSSRFSAGFGLQYSLVGFRYDSYRDFVGFYVSGGLGLSGGIEVALPSRNFAIGVNVGGAPFFLHYSAHINYYLNGYRKKGLLVGLEAGEYAIGASPTIKRVAMLTLAQKF